MCVKGRRLRRCIYILSPGPTPRLAKKTGEFQSSSVKCKCVPIHCVTQWMGSSGAGWAARPVQSSNGNTLTTRLNWTGLKFASFLPVAEFWTCSELVEWSWVGSGSGNGQKLLPNSRDPVFSYGHRSTRVPIATLRSLVMNNANSW